MSPAGVLSFALVSSVLLFGGVEAHGKMMSPNTRPISQQYLKDSGALINIGGGQIQIAPIEGLSQNKQKDYPIAKTFDLMNGCRGTVYEEGNNVTTLQPGKDFDVTWQIDAPHPGYMTLTIVKPSKDATGKIMYKNYKTLTRVEPFAEHGGEGSVKVKMPTNVKGCERPGDCTLQFFWYSKIANQTYPSCADIVVPGSGSGTTSTTTTTQKTTTTTTATTAPKRTTTTPTATKSPSTTGSDTVAGEADTTAKCNRRMRD